MCTDISVLMLLCLQKFNYLFCFSKHSLICRHKRKDFSSAAKFFCQIFVYTDALIIQIPEIINCILRMFHIGFRTQIKILKRTDNALSCTINQSSDFCAKNFRMSIQQVIAHTEKRIFIFQNQEAAYLTVRYSTAKIASTPTNTLSNT